MATATHRMPSACHCNAIRMAAICLLTNRHRRHIQSLKRGAWVIWLGTRRIPIGTATISRSCRFIWSGIAAVTDPIPIASAARSKANGAGPVLGATHVTGHGHRCPPYAIRKPLQCHQDGNNMLASGSWNCVGCAWTCFARSLKTDPNRSRAGRILGGTLDLLRWLLFLLRPWLDLHQRFPFYHRTEP